MAEVTVYLFAEKTGLKIITKGKEMLTIREGNVNRPGLQLSGFFRHFRSERLQVFGESEMTFYDTLIDEEKQRFLYTFFAYNLLGIVICRGIPAPQEFIDACEEHGIPLFTTEEGTSDFITRVKSFFSYLLAEKCSVPGVLVDVLGTGILLTGDSGIGKSETALELIRHGHKLVADDVVDLVKVDNERIIGSAPERIRFLMEIRGLGIIDVRQMFGVGAVLTSKRISLVIELMPFETVKEMGFDRLDRNKHYQEILGVNIRKIVLPVAPGRNIASIIEIAVQNIKLDDMGYNIWDELDAKITR